MNRAMMLDLAGARFRRAVHLPGLEHVQFPDVIATAMPGVQCWRQPSTLIEIMLSDPATTSAVHIVITGSAHTLHETRVRECGPRDLFDEAVAAVCMWEQHGRTISTGSAVTSDGA